MAYIKYRKSDGTYGTIPTVSPEIATLNELYAAKTHTHTASDISDISDYVDSAISGKVDKETGKGLSTNDYSDTDKAKVDAALTEHQDISGKLDKTEAESTYQAKGNYVTYTANSNITAGKKSNVTTYKYGQSPMVVPRGIIIGGTSAEAGLVTRGICGVTTPNSSTGACTPENLYINNDGDSKYTRVMVLGAAEAGAAITVSTAPTTVADVAMGNLYSAVRGDQMVNYVSAKVKRQVVTSTDTSVTLAANTITLIPDSTALASLSVALPSGATSDGQEYILQYSKSALSDSATLTFPSTLKWANGTAVIAPSSMETDSVIQISIVNGCAVWCQYYTAS